MTLDLLTGRQCDRGTTIKQRVQTNQHTGIRYDGRLLYLHNPSVPHRLYKRSVHVTESLVGILLFFGFGGHFIQSFPLNYLKQLVIDRILGDLLIVFSG